MLWTQLTGLWNCGKLLPLPHWLWQFSCPEGSLGPPSEVGELRWQPNVKEKTWLKQNSDRKTQGPLTCFFQSFPSNPASFLMEGSLLICYRDSLVIHDPTVDTLYDYWGWVSAQLKPLQMMYFLQIQDSPEWKFFWSLPRQLNNHSHLGSPSLRDPHEGQLGQRPTSGPNDSVRTLPRRIHNPANSSPVT